MYYGYGYGRGMGYGMGFDPMYLLVILMAILCMVASWRVSSVYKKYARIRRGTAEK